MHSSTVRAEAGLFTQNALIIPIIERGMCPKSHLRVVVPRNLWLDKLLGLCFEPLKMGGPSFQIRRARKFFRFFVGDASVAGNGFLHGFTTTKPTFLETKPCFWHVSINTGPPDGLLMRHFKEFLAQSVLLVDEKLLLIHSPSFVTS